VETRSIAAATHQSQPPPAAEPSNRRPPGSFVSGEHEQDCARFLAEIRSIVRRRSEQASDGVRSGSPSPTI
jgi:hypothetical protein